MSHNALQQALKHLTAAELEELDSLLAIDMQSVRWRPLEGPQSAALESEADIIGYGGSAGGGKTDLIVGLCTQHHDRSLIVRREKAQTRGIVQRIAEVLGSSDGYSSQLGEWRLPQGRLVEFAGLDNAGDERRWQGRPHDLIAFDEATEQREYQVRFLMGWLRSGKPAQRKRVVMTFNPPTTKEGEWVIQFFAPWLDSSHPNPAQPGELRWYTTINGQDEEVRDSKPFVLLGAEKLYEYPANTPEEDVITPKSRTFIPSRLTDNPYYMAAGYMAQLQALPEPLRSQMLYGDFRAGIKEDRWQVIPTAWVDAAMARWRQRTVKGEMACMGVDVARGGQDKTVIATRYSTPTDGQYWFDELQIFDGVDTPDGQTVAGQVISCLRDAAPINIDVIGVGASPYDVLNSTGLQVQGVNVAQRDDGADASGRLRFVNLRSGLWWRMRELLDPAADNGVCLPPSKSLKEELCAPKWSLKGASIQVEGREDVYKRIKRSVDQATAVILCAMDTPRRPKSNRASSKARLEYDPYA